MRSAPSHSERHAYFDRVATVARNLLELLDERDNVRTLVNDTKIAGGLTGDGAGFSQLRSEAVSLPRWWIPDGVVITTPMTTAGPTPAGLSQEVVFQQIDLAPRAIAMVLLVAEHAARFDVRGASAVGRKRDEGVDALFTHLACMFFAMFGDRPSIGSDRTDPAQDSFRWITTILDCLHARARAIRVTRLTPSHRAPGRAIAYGCLPSEVAFHA